MPTTTSAPESDAAEEASNAAAALDGALHASVAALTGGLSPISLTLAYTDWALHLAAQPAQTLQLALAAQRQAIETAACALASPPCDPSPGEDLRFSHPGWQQWPFATLVQAYRDAEAWWQSATRRHGMTPHHQDVMRIHARQWLDLLSPANFPLTNPEVLQRSRERLGGNFVEGFEQALDEWRQREGLAPLHAPAQRYQPGLDVAVTPGKVVHRNALVELIQYAPQTARVRAEPLLIVPSWIMKYYVLDLSPHNSLVRWLVERGHTVFIVSWRNPEASDALLDMGDYLELGVFDPLAAIARRYPGVAVHACGYCLGGTLMAIAAAALARPAGIARKELLAPLASVSLLAAETDFSEPGELGVLIDDSQVAMLEALMAEQGYLSGRQMAGSFQFLHARELIWSARTRELLLGERLRPNDLMAWNADVTRLPAAMHSEYLHRCYLRNELAEGRFPVEGRPVSLTDLRLPMFVLATEKDHVSPWRSVYKLHRLTDSALTFALTNGGHNAGVVSEPSHPGRHHALHTRQPGDPALDPDSWRAQADCRDGSWWLSWDRWLRRHGRTARVPARTIDPATALDDAPGDYVMQRYRD